MYDIKDRLSKVSLTHEEISNLIELYYTRIEELEDLECIKNFDDWKYDFSTDKEANDTFVKLLN